MDQARETTPLRRSISSTARPTMPLSELNPKPAATSVVQADKPAHFVPTVVDIQEGRRSDSDPVYPTPINREITEQSREAQAVHAEWLRRTREHVDSPYYTMKVTEQFNAQGALRALVVRRTYSPDGDEKKGFYTEKKVSFRSGGRVSAVDSSLTKYQSDGHPQELDSHTVREQTEDVSPKREPYSNPAVERVAQVIETVLSPKYDPNGEDILRTGFVKPDHVVHGRRERTFWERVRDPLNFTDKGTVRTEWVGSYTKDLKAINEAQQAMDASLQKHQEHLASQKAQSSQVSTPASTATTPIA